MESPRRYVVPTVAMLTAFGVGLGTGVHLAKKRARAPFVLQEERTTVGAALGNDPARRKIVAAAYLDPNAALRDLDVYAWSVPNTLLPLVGAVPSPGRHANATIDAFGFRDAREPAMPKPPRTIRIFLTGGSVAFGACAPSQESTIAPLLEAILNREDAGGGVTFEVFTAANAGWTSAHERAFVEARVASLAPDLVVSLTGANDIVVGFQGRDVAVARAYGDEPFVHAAAVARGGTYAPEPEGAPLAVELIAERLLRNERAAAAAIAPARLVVALQPSLPTATKKRTEREEALLAREVPSRMEYERAAASAIAARARAEGIAFVDLRGAYDALGGAEVFVDVHHVADRGNRALAEAIHAAIRPLLRERAGP